MSDIENDGRGRCAVAFVGNVDHGKSTLIGRLLYDTGAVPPERLEEIGISEDGETAGAELAHLMDSLQEEREGGLTIDTTQVFFETAARDYVFVDAPGHREFIRNMMTGAGEADAAVLMVDAAEGVGNQTWRHAFLLSLLGVRNCIVIVNKMDLVAFEQERFEALRESVLELAERVDLALLAVIPASAKFGDNVVVASGNMPWYDGPLAIEALESIPATETTKLPMRYSVQDAYAWEDSPVYPGRVESGMLRAGEKARVLPDGFDVTVRAVKRFPEDLSVAETGACVGVTLAETKEIRRGQVLSDPDDLPATATSFNARLFWLGERPLLSGETFNARIACQEGPCTAVAIHRRVDTATLNILAEVADRLEEDDVGEVTLFAQRSFVMEEAACNPALGRILVEREGEVVGAGVITTIEPKA